MGQWKETLYTERKWCEAGIEEEEPGGLKTTISDVNQSGRWYRVFTPPPSPLPPPPTIIKQLHSFLSILLPTLGRD